MSYPVLAGLLKDTPVYEERDKFLLGIADHGRSKAWSFVDLEKKTPIHETWDGQPIVVVFDTTRSTPRLFRRTVKGQVLTFAQEGKHLKDQETGTTWDALSGQATAGPLAGQRLDCLPAIISYRKIWNNFHPGSETANK